MHVMPNSQQLQEKWEPVLNHGSMPEISDPYRRAVTAILLENQERAIAEQALAEGSGTGLLTEAPPVTSTGNDGAANTGFTSAGGTGRAGYDPILISLIRRAAPQLIAYDIVGVQPMSGPTGLVFYLKSQYVANAADNTTSAGNEALHGEAITGHSSGSSGANVGGVEDAGASGTQGTDPFMDEYTASPNFGAGMGTETAEALGDVEATNAFRQMTFGIDKTSVTAKSRALKAEYTTELAQDLKAIHGLDAEQELANILSTEILAEINREVVHTVNDAAVAGGAGLTAPGTWDVADGDGRWSVEKYKGLHFQLEKEANEIATSTRRGRGNIIIGSANAIAALSLTGAIEAGNLSGGGQVSQDGITGNTFVGTLNGQFKVYVDPYFAGEAGTEITGRSGTTYANAVTQNYLTVGYKGSSPYDAGIFYCPYVPLQMVKAIGENTFQPKIGFKTRYGMLANPFANASNSLATGTNNYYRTLRITGI